MKIPFPVSMNVLGHMHSMEELDVVLVDDSLLKTVNAHIRPFPIPLTLWSGEDYEKAGDYTQADAERRILELLLPDMKSKLDALQRAPDA